MFNARASHNDFTLFKSSKNLKLLRRILTLGRLSAKPISGGRRIARRRLIAVAHARARTRTRRRKPVVGNTSDAVGPAHLLGDVAAVAVAHHDLAAALDPPDHHALRHALDHRAPRHPRHVDVHQSDVLDAAGQLGRDLARVVTVAVPDDVRGRRAGRVQQVAAGVGDAVGQRAERDHALVEEAGAVVVVVGGALGLALGLAGQRRAQALRHPRRRPDRLRRQLARVGCEVVHLAYVGARRRREGQRLGRRLSGVGEVLRALRHQVAQVARARHDQPRCRSCVLHQ